MTPRCHSHCSDRNSPLHNPEPSATGCSDVNNLNRRKKKHNLDRGQCLGIVIDRGQSRNNFFVNQSQITLDFFHCLMEWYFT